MSATTATLTHCPTCGVKLHRTDLSLCAYCAAPLRMGAAVSLPDDETQRMFKKIEAHPGFAAAMQWTPMDPRIEAKAARVAAWGWASVGLMAFFALLGLFVGDGGYIGRWPVLVAVCISTATIFLLGGAATMRGNARHQAMLRRPARVLDRRSRTEFAGGKGATVYYFQLRFVDGSEGEFHMPGRGTMYEPPTIGACGLAYSRGTDLIEFKRF